MGIRVAFLVLLAVGLAQAKTNRMSMSMMDACFPVTPMEKLNHQPTRAMQIFTDFEFSCAGEIAAWNLYAGQKGHFYAAVWRKHPDGRYEMIGKNYIEASKKGQQTYFIPRHLRFKVNTGDLLGIHYDSKTGRSVIPYEDDTKKKVDQKVALSATISIANMYNDDLDLGQVLKAKQTLQKGKRAAALFPVMNKNRLRLDGGRNKLEGRAMFFSNGVWGTICDARFTETGWPDVFCKELGYDHCQNAEKAHKMYTGVGKGPIGYQKPSCPLTGNLFMDECGKDKGTCDHDVDVFVECAYAVKLVGGKDSSEGRAMSVKRAGRKYKWGTICDNKPEVQGWASTLCHEIGFSHAAEATKAKETPVGKGHGDIYLQNPTCEADKPYHLSYCAKKGKKCNHNEDVFVKCQYGVRVTGGKTAAEGLAEVYRHGKWGTVCLDTIQREMFPSVFCKNLGYERAESVSYAKKAYTNVGSGHINEMNPDCSPQDANNVLNCGHPKPTGCTHDKDVFIKCANNDICKRMKPCQNKAVCIDMENDYKCECAKGFTGPNCEQDIDDCSPNPCKFGGKCIDKVNDYKCLCDKERHGANCEHYRMPANHFTLRSFDEPTKNIYLDDSHSELKLTLSTASRVFWFENGHSAGTVKLVVQGKSKLFVRTRGTGLSFTRSSNTDTYFNIEESEEHPGYFAFHSVNADKYIVHNGDKMEIASGDKTDADFMKKALFYIHDMDAQSSIMMYNKKNFKGVKIGLTEGDDNLKNHGFNNKLTSFEIHGNSAWELFDETNYNGKSIIAQPGRYDVDWVKSHIKNNKVSSARKVEHLDGLVLWADAKFQGARASISSSVKNLSKKTSLKSVKSIEVVGPSSWELYTKAGFKGAKVVVAPGRFPADWVDEHLKGEIVLSARKVEINTPMCSASSGTQKMVGKSGAEHNVFVSHRQDGSVWMRFGEGNKKDTWTYNSYFDGALRTNIISKKEIAAMKDFSVIDWEVHTDLNMQVSVDNSWHPSKINVMYLGSKKQDTFKFKNTFSDRTDISFAADKSQLACTGSVKDGKVLSNVCGEEGLPEYGTASSHLAITSVYLNPRAVQAYAMDRDFKRNAFTWSGSYYYVYAKLADCASSTGCYKREKDVSYVFDKVLPKTDNRPETFYFGQMDQDLDACQAACKDEADCVAYTLYHDTGKKLQGGCYGVGKSQVGKSVKMAGAFSGKATECGSFIPEYMEEDMWTRNSTGCPCMFDTSRTDCACCHEGACHCESRYKYQCTLCGFNDRCGSPFLTTSHGEYIFEYENQELSETGRHYKVPDLCVTSCEMDVRGAGSAASEVAAYMTDFAGDRVLSCVASDLDKAQKSTVHTDGATTVLKGSRISRVNLYSFGGVGEMIQLRLKVNKNGCPVVKQDERYIGCFAMDAKDENSKVHVQTQVSNHMSRSVCIKHCHNNRYNYAMLESGTTCVCSNNLPTSGPAFTCDRFCSGDSRQVCGGMMANSVYMTKFNAHAIIVASGPSDCKSIGGVLAGVMQTAATGEECKKLTGAATSGDEVIQCPVNMCAVNKIGAGVFPARPGSCGARKVAEILVRTKGADCLDMGGNPTYQQNDWGMCQIDYCTTDKPRNTIFSPVPPQSCPAYARVAEVEVKATLETCRTLGGAAHMRTVDDKDESFCQFEFCIQNKNPVKGNIYNFPHNNEVIEEGASHFFSLPKMCVTECQFGFQATAEGLSIAGVTLMGEDKKEAGLFCGGEANNFTSESSLGFADLATGVFVTGIEITAKNHSLILNELKLRTNPDGCKNDEEMIVLYNKPNFGGRPKIIKDDLGDLETVDFNNKATSFKIYGDMQWEMFEHKSFKGRSAVLASGEYYDTSLLPFGNNDLSSVHRVGTINANMEQTRREISNARGIVCFKRTPKSSAVFGLPPNTPKGENRPRVFFFGNFGNDIDRCERACREEPQCSAFTLYSTVTDDSLKAWRGLCYGRSFRDDVQVYQEDVMSGYVAACAEEDTLTLYGEKEYAGVHSTIIEDTVNVTFSAGPLSAMVTGKDTWRVLTESDGHIHTYNLAPGDYTDLSATFTGRVFQVSKMHPNTQLYKAQHNQVDLAPVAFNQIKQTITETRTKVSELRENKTQCNTTNEADVFFVIDASSSIFAHNYVKVLDFVAKVTESFSLGDSSVRVGTILFSFYTHYDITLGKYTESSDLEAAIKGLTYYKGGTYTHSALKAVREEGFTDAVIRSGVSKQAIIITDGQSRRPDKTTSEAHLCRDNGITLTAVGIKGANYDELHNIAGDASRVYNVTDFDQLGDIISAIEKTTCSAVDQGKTVWNITEHVTITVQGNDTNYFVHEDWEFNRKPVALGMESGVIYNSQIFASSALFGHEAWLGRLNHNSGWMTTIGNHTNQNEWIEIDLGKILPIHGISTQGHAIETSWVTMYKIAISLDGIHFVTFKDTNTSLDLIFIGNSDQSTIKYHCLHRLFGQAIHARVVRFIAVEWHIKIAMRIELYGYRDADDSQVVETLRKDVWTRNVTGCPCYFDSSRKDCACCEDGGCQCPNTDRHQCVQCGYPHMCGTPNLRNPVNNIDGWTSSLSGCRCAFDPLRTDCACCQSYGCQCGAGNKNQCVNCGHPEHCGLKEHIFGPNPYCLPQTCPRKINTIWEGDAPHGVNPGEHNGVVKEIAASVVQAAMKAIGPA